MDFKAVEAHIDVAAPRLSRAKAGQPPNPTVLMIKILTLSQRYNLSVDSLEYLLRDRRSFQRLQDLTKAAAFPTLKKISLFRDRRAQAGLDNQVFGQV
jgi:hypothetical protein